MNWKQYVMLAAYVLALVGGIAHVSPASVSGIVGYNVLGVATVQVLAGLSILVISILGLWKYMRD